MVEMHTEIEAILCKEAERMSDDGQVGMRKVRQWEAGE
jgi:hypothetical protein